MSYEIRALSLAELLDTAFQLLRERFLLLSGLAALFQLPIAVLFGPVLGDPQALARLGEDAVLAAVGLFALFAVLFALAFPVVAAAVTRAVGDLYVAQRASWGRSLGTGLRLLAPLVVTFLLYSLIALAAATFVFGGAALALLGVSVLLEGASSVGLVIVAILGMLGVSAVYYLFVVTPFAVLMQIVVFEDLAFFAGIGRAFQLVAGQRLRVFAVLLVANIIFAIPLSGLSIAFSGLNQMGAAWPWIGALLSGLAQSVGFAFTSTAGVVLYFDLRCRKEGFDLEHLARAVEARTAADAAPRGAP